MFPSTLVLLLPLFTFVQCAPRFNNPTASDPEAIFVAPPSTPETIKAASDASLMMAYYPDWAGDASPPESIDFARFDWIDFAFAIPDENFNLTWDNSDSSPDLLRRLVTKGHQGGTKVKLSVGGWTGSQHFSPAVATEESRKTFVDNIACVYQAFGLDGIDIDWEYPGRMGNDGNKVDPTDTQNFLCFLQLLKATLPPSAIITAAAQTIPFAGPQEQSMVDVSQFATVLDWILLMNYDVWSASTTPGPNAPLFDGCGNSTQLDANAVAAVDSWKDAGFPVQKLVLGVPSYGYTSMSNATSLRTRRNERFIKARTDGPAGTVKIASEEGSSDGSVQFRELVKQGALTRSTTVDGETVYNGAGGFVRNWDECSATPFLQSSSAGQVVSYDDPKSLNMKAQFAKKVGMLGVNMFDVHGDTDEWDLTDALRAGLL